MLRPDFGKWNQSADEILRLALDAGHRRSRERFQALYMIGTRQTNATKWSRQIGRKNQTVMNWVREYNTKGPESIHYKRTGGNSPLLRTRKKA